MSHHITIIVPAGKTRERLDLYLTHHVENATRAKVQRAIRTGLVLVNGVTARASHLVAPGDILQVTIPKPPAPEVVPEDIPLDIIYEDSFLLVVNKPAGMVTHPAFGNYTGTLVNALLFHSASLSSAQDVTRPGIVHRLDKDTSGLLVVAKDDHTHALLARQFSRHTIEREYQAIVWGTLPARSGVIEANLGRSISDRKKIAVVPQGKPAATEYTVLEEFAYLSLVQLNLRTGRTHQIRVHLAHIHHPVFGDPTYNGRRLLYGPGTPKHKAEVQKLLDCVPRQALHARTLGFVHPVTREILRFEAPLPSDMQKVLDLLRHAPAV